MEVERMNGRVVVESGMGQLQVAVAGLGEGGLWQGMRAGQGTWYPGSWAPGHTLASCAAARTSAGGSRRRCHSRLAVHQP